MVTIRLSISDTDPIHKKKSRFLKMVLEKAYLKNCTGINYNAQVNIAVDLRRVPEDIIRMEN